MSQRRLAQPGRAIEQYMVQRFSPALGGGNGDTQVLLNPGLADEIVERLRPEAGVQRDVLGARFT
jgi:hypothetical protein